MTIGGVRMMLKQINYLLTRQEVETLYKYAKLVPDNGTIVDIGTAAGGSAFTMAFGSKNNVKVYTIDPMMNDHFLYKRKEWGLQDKICFYNETSSNCIEYFNNKTIDLLFVDGIHNYQGVTDDFNNYGNIVKPGGIIIFHDYYLYNNTIGKAIDDLIYSGKIRQIEIIDSLFNRDVRTGMFVAEKI